MQAAAASSQAKFSIAAGGKSNSCRVTFNDI